MFQKKRSEDVFKLWIDHGIRPQGRRGGLVNVPMLAKDVKYQYVVIPSTSAEEMNKDQGIKIVVNNRLVQAVKSEKSGLVQAIFYQAGDVVFSEDLALSVESPAALILKISGGVVKEISAADPSRKLSHLHLKISDKSGVNDCVVELPSGFFAGQSVSIDL